MIINCVLADGHDFVRVGCRARFSGIPQIDVGCQERSSEDRRPSIPSFLLLTAAMCFHSPDKVFLIESIPGLVPFHSDNPYRKIPSLLTGIAGCGLEDYVAQLLELKADPNEKGKVR